MKSIPKTKKQIKNYKVIDSNKEAKEYWDEHELNSKYFELIETFENDYGELFVIYHEKGSAIIYITGDELGWGCIWRLDPVTLRITREFYVNDDELKEISKIISKLEIIKKI